MSFTNLTLTTLDDRPGWFRVENAITWRSDKLPLGQYNVPEGTETDLASIPALLRPFFSRTGKSRKPAVFHDDMYGRKWRTRKMCDQMLYHMLRERGMGRFRAKMYYAGVRMGGWTRGNW